MASKNAGKSISEIARDFGCSPTTVKRACKRHGISLARTKAVKTCAYCGGVKRGPIGRYCSVTCHQAHLFSELFARFLAGYEIQGTPKLFRRLVLHRDGHICANCQLTEWQGAAIPLELEHVDGNSANNAANNLKMLCPNCHAQTLTYKSKNKGNGRHVRRERYAKGLSY